LSLLIYFASERHAEQAAREMGPWPKALLTRKQVTAKAAHPLLSAPAIG